MTTKTQIEGIKRLLYEFSSAEYQDRVWVRGLGPQVSSYEEALSTLFDNLMFEDFLQEASTKDVLNPKQLRDCNFFVDHLNEFDASLRNLRALPDAFSSSKWEKVRRAAELASKAFAHVTI